MIYLDYAANYPTKKIVLDYLSEVELKYYANLNSSHKFGKRCLDFVKNENNLILQLLGLNDDYEIVHTSSATEANNLAIKGIVKAYSGFGNKVLVSELEHNSINGCLGFLKENGLVVDFIKTSNGHIDPIDLKNKMSNNVILVIATMLDSEVGTVEPIDEILEAIKNFEAPKTAEMASVLNKIVPLNKCLLIDSDFSENQLLSIRNLNRIFSIDVNSVNALDLSRYPHIIMTERALNAFLERVQA